MARSRLLSEGDSDPLFLAPDHAAEPGRAVDHQVELSRDADRAGDIEGCAAIGKIADGAIDRAAAELDFSAFQDPASGCNPVFVHRIVSLQKCNIFSCLWAETRRLSGFSASSEN